MGEPVVWNGSINIDLTPWGVYRGHQLVIWKERTEFEKRPYLCTLPNIVNSKQKGDAIPNFQGYRTVR